MNEIRRSITDELRRIADSYKSDFEVARARETSLQKSLAELISQAGTSGQAQVTLRDLESSAQTARNLYDSFLQRFLEATQQQTLPINEARLINRRDPARSRRAGRKTKILLPGSLVLGLMLGVAAALMRDRLDDVFPHAPRTSRAISASNASASCRWCVPASGGTGRAGGRVVRPISRKATITRYVADAPFSRFTESMRSVKVAIDISGLTREARDRRRLGGAERGQDHLRLQLATLMAQNGQKVLLIDGDLRNPLPDPGPRPGRQGRPVRGLTQTQPLSDVLYSEAGNGLQMLPAVLKGPNPHTAEMISSRAMAALLDSAAATTTTSSSTCRRSSRVDVRAAAHLMDAFVCVTEWGQTSREVVARGVRQRRRAARTGSSAWCSTRPIRAPSSASRATRVGTTRATIWSRATRPEPGRIASDARGAAAGDRGGPSRVRSLPSDRARPPFADPRRSLRFPESGIARAWGPPGSAAERDGGRTAESGSVRDQVTRSPVDRSRCGNRLRSSAARACDAVSERIVQKPYHSAAESGAVAAGDVSSVS